MRACVRACVCVCCVVFQCNICLSVTPEVLGGVFLMTRSGCFGFADCYKVFSAVDANYIGDFLQLTHSQEHEKSAR